MLDSYGREINYLRVSVTDRCNFRCLYCKPSPNHKKPVPFEKIISLVRAAKTLGIERVRLTGGEPLIRDDIVSLIKELSFIKDLSISTNGSLLADLAKDLRDKGLRRVNISLDSLKADKFKWITGGGKLKDVLLGIEETIGVGLRPIKLNMVVMKGLNDLEIFDMAKLTFEGVDVRFIELMPIGEAGNFKAFLSVKEVKRELEERFELELSEADGGGPAKYYKIKGAKGKIGFIGALSEMYCERCNRIRLTSSGELLPCLASPSKISLNGDPLELLKRAILEKPRGHRWKEGEVTHQRMSCIGG
jgi:cyclic pyranopterin phosphate synthase